MCSAMQVSSALQSHEHNSEAGDLCGRKCLLCGVVLALIIDKGSRCDRPVFRNVRFVPAVGDVLKNVL